MQCQANQINLFDEYTKAIELNPKYAGAYYNRGTVYLKSKTIR